MRTFVNASVVSLLLSSSSAIQVKDVKDFDDVTEIQVPRNSLDAIEEQESDLKQSLYPAAMIQQNKTENAMSNETKASHA
jgi:hypothetical protein